VVIIPNFLIVNKSLCNDFIIVSVSTSFTNKDRSVFELKLQYTPLVYVEQDVTAEDPLPRQSNEGEYYLYIFTTPQIIYYILVIDWK